MKLFYKNGALEVFYDNKIPKGWKPVELVTIDLNKETHNTSGFTFEELDDKVLATPIKVKKKIKKEKEVE